MQGGFKLKIQIDSEVLEFEIKQYSNTINFILKGDCGAVVISYWLKLDSLDLNIHTHKPFNDYVKQSKEICEFIGTKCYSDCRYLDKKINDIDILQILKNEYNYIKRATE